jgi:hypothetical protein
MPISRIKNGPLEVAKMFIFKIVFLASKIVNFNHPPYFELTKR